MEGGRRGLTTAVALLLLQAAAAMRFSHYDWDYHQPAQPYSHVPYGRLGSYFPDAYKYMPYARAPLYFDVRGRGARAESGAGAGGAAPHPGPRPNATVQPTDPEGSRPTPAAFNFSDPYRGAGYLPQELMGRHNALYPSFGFVPGPRPASLLLLPRPNTAGLEPPLLAPRGADPGPRRAVNYVSPHYHPQFPGGKWQPPSRFSHPEGFMDLVPYDVPIPGWHGGSAHPLYAPWYKPGIAHRRRERPRIQPYTHQSLGDERHGAVADFPAPNARYRVERPLYMDRCDPAPVTFPATASSHCHCPRPGGPWPSMGPTDVYSTVPSAPPPPPPGAAGSGSG